MVDPKEQTREAIQKLITYVAGLQQFDRKMDVMNALLNVEWFLRPEQEKKASIDDAVEIHEEYEPHWE